MHCVQNNLIVETVEITYSADLYPNYFNLHDSAREEAIIF